MEIFGAISEVCAEHCTECSRGTHFLTIKISKNLTSQKNVRAAIEGAIGCYSTIMNHIFAITHVTSGKSSQTKNNVLQSTRGGICVLEASKKVSLDFFSQ